MVTPTPQLNIPTPQNLIFTSQDANNPKIGKKFVLPCVYVHLNY